MLIVSQNISNHNITFSNDVIYRINLAWINNLQELENLLKKHDKQKIFLDLPTNRIKPPNNKYTLNDLISVISSYNQIKYFAISNVESASDLEDYIQKIPPNIILVPKNGTYVLFRIRKNFTHNKVTDTSKNIYLYKKSIF